MWFKGLYLNIKFQKGLEKQIIHYSLSLNFPNQIFLVMKITKSSRQISVIHKEDIIHTQICISTCVLRQSLYDTSNKENQIKNLYGQKFKSQQSYLNRMLPRVKIKVNHRNLRRNRRQDSRCFPCHPSQLCGRESE